MINTDLCGIHIDNHKKQELNQGYLIDEEHKNTQHLCGGEKKVVFGKFLYFFLAETKFRIAFYTGTNIISGRPIISDKPHNATNPKMRQTP